VPLVDAGNPMRVPFAKQTLENGLDVIVHEDHHVPLVAVSVWYHVGSKNEHRGRTGLAHLFEHLMFEGSEHQPQGFFEPLQRAGASLNGSTGPDRTNYWEVVPREAARLALWMEADRMGWLLPALSASRFATQRDVVLNERRQSYENRPYGLAQFALLDATYPAEHPYSWPTIGDPDDLRTATIDDARDFFTRYYHPRNASLAVAGDIPSNEAFALARELFGEIPAGPPVPPVTAPHPPARPRRIVLEDRVELPRLYLAWAGPALFEAGDAELDLAGDLLANGRTSRMYRRLTHDERIATELAASQASRELGGHFQIIATAAPGHTLAELEAAIGEELNRLSSGGPTTDELERGRVQAEAAFVYRLQTLGGFGGKTDQLNAYNVYRGTPDFFDRDLQRYLDVTGDSLRSVVGSWLDPRQAVVLSVVPIGHPEQAAPASEPALST
jgi:zinc protease